MNCPVNHQTHNTFRSVESELVFRNGSESIKVVKYPVSGVIMGLDSKMWIPLIVSKEKTQLNVIFVYDTCSPYTYLSKSILKKLGYVDFTPDNIIVNLHGVTMNVFLSTNHLQNINVLGQDFMKLSGLDVVISYRDLSFQLKKNN